ncbi:unnamed protein product [Heterobilharzia americana]|nr:unnamed protein product [Heterobilharzia americana]CAH8618822.1 unnamed protein product [Heterobilharzia americana]
MFCESLIFDVLYISHLNKSSMHKTSLKISYRLHLDFVIYYILINFCLYSTSIEQCRALLNKQIYNTIENEYGINERYSARSLINLVLIYLTVFQSNLLRWYKEVVKDKRVFWLLTLIILSHLIHYPLERPTLQGHALKLKINNYINLIQGKIYNCLAYLDGYLTFPTVEARQPPVGFPEPPEKFTSYEQMVDYLAAVNQYYQVFGRSRYG